MVTQVATHDVYEAAYYILNNCQLVDIEGLKVNSKILCNLIIAGENISNLQLKYLNGEATANILNLRRMVGQVNAWVHTAKKKFKNQLKQQEAQA